MNTQKRMLMIRVNIIIAILIALVSLAVLFSTHSLKSTFFTTIFLLSMSIILTCILTQWREMLLLAIALVAISYLYTSAVNTIIISFAFNLTYIKLKFNPNWENRKKEIENYFRNSDVSNKYKFNVDFFDAMKERDKTYTTMLIYGFSVLPATIIESLEKINEKGYDIPLINESKAYEGFLRMWNLSIDSKPELKRMALGLFFILLFLIIIISTCFIIKEQRQIQRQLWERKRRKVDYWKENIPAINENDLIYIDVITTSHDNDTKKQKQLL